MSANSVNQQRKQDEQKPAAEFSDSSLVSCQLIGDVFLVT
jgi:hypothetical protein